MSRPLRNLPNARHLQPRRRGGLLTREATAPAIAAFLLLIAAGLIAWAVHEPLLFPSLGPTVFIQVHGPRTKAGSSWNTLVGHMVGVAAALLALIITRTLHTPSPMMTGHLTWQREVASALAVALTIAGQVPLRADHPPAAATTLLITLGAINPEWRAVAVILAGVVLITGLEQLIRPVLLRLMPPSDHRFHPPPWTSLRGPS